MDRSARWLGIPRVSFSPNSEPRTINIPQKSPHIFLCTLPLKFSLFLQMQKHAKRSNTKAMESVNNIPVEVNESSP